MLSSIMFANTTIHHIFNKTPLGKIFRVEQLRITERIQLINPYRSFIMSYMKMDRPDDIEKFKQKVHDHFMKYDWCRSRIISVGKFYFFEKVSAENMVEITEEMDHKQVQKFMENMSERDPEENEAWHKIWLVPDGEFLYIVHWTHHAITDGLGLM